MERIAFEGEGLLEVGELLVGEAGGFAQRAGSAVPAYGGVLVGEATLERHEHVATVRDVSGDLVEQRIVGDVESGDDEQLVLLDGGWVIDGFREDEVCADVGVVQGAMKLHDELAVAVAGFAGNPAGSVIALIGHEVDAVGGVDAVEDRDLVFDLEID